ncbi:RDD family protein [Lysobacter sp. HA35]
MTNKEPDRSPPLPVAAIAAGYDASIVVRRWLGAWIDFIVLASFLLIPDYVLGNERYQATLVVWIALLVAYFPAMEILFGKTVGKFATGTRVVNAAGGRPSLGQSLVRTLFRLIEVNPLLAGGIPAGIAVVASRHKQRLGDMVANTYVILARDLRGHASTATANDATAEPPPLPGVA